MSRVIEAGRRWLFVVTGADRRERSLNEIRINPAPRITLALGGPSGARVELPLEPYKAR